MYNEILIKCNAIIAQYDYQKDKVYKLIVFKWIILAFNCTGPLAVLIGYSFREYEDRFNLPNESLIVLCVIVFWWLNLIYSVAHYKNDMRKLILYFSHNYELQIENLDWQKAIDTKVNEQIIDCLSKSNICNMEQANIFMSILENEVLIKDKTEYKKMSLFNTIIVIIISYIITILFSSSLTIKFFNEIGSQKLFFIVIIILLSIKSLEDILNELLNNKFEKNMSKKYRTEMRVIEALKSWKH